MMKSVTEINGARLLKDIEDEKSTLEDVSFGSMRNWSPLDITTTISTRTTTFYHVLLRYLNRNHDRC